MSTMTITVLETATIFEAEETIYRYDLPGTGITEGWAIEGIVEQAKTQLPDWPEVEITIDADSDIVNILSEAFTGESVTSLPTEVATEETTDFSAAEPEQPWRQWGNVVLYVAMAVVVAIIGGIAWWAVGEPTTDPVEPSVVEVHNHGVIDISLPPGYHLEPTGTNAGTLTGSDANLRILVAADPLNDASSAAVFTELSHMIASDPALEETETFSAGRGTEVGYLERPADGSEVWWVVWVDGGYMVSFGCHSKTGAPNVPQRATCREIAQGLTIRG